MSFDLPDRPFSGSTYSPPFDHPKYGGTWTLRDYPIVRFGTTGPPTPRLGTSTLSQCRTHHRTREGTGTTGLLGIDGSGYTGRKWLHSWKVQVWMDGLGLGLCLDGWMAQLNNFQKYLPFPIRVDDGRCRPTSHKCEAERRENGLL